MVYYVDSVAGNDNNAGTLAAPWETDAVLNRTTFWPADQVLKKRGGIFGACQRDTCRVMSSSGVADSAIVEGAYGDPNLPIPVETAARHITGWAVAADGHTVSHVKTASDSTFALWVRNVLGTRVMTQAALDANREWRTTADTLLVYLTAAADTAFIDRSKAAAFSSSAKSWLTVTGIRFTHAINLISTGVTSTGVGLSTGSNIIFTKCTVDSMPGYSAVRVAANHVTIASSLFTGNGSNVVAQSDSGSFLNNTVIGGGQGFFERIATKDWIIKNNIFQDQISKFIIIGSTEASTYIGSNNLFFMTSGVYINMWQRKTTNFSTLSSWADSTGQESGSIVADPRFVNAAAGDYRLAPGSPATRLGVNLWSAGVTSDITGKLYPNNTQRKISAGAYYRKVSGMGMGEIGNEIKAEIISEMRNW
jgi:hypothetical protein